MRKHRTDDKFRTLKSLANDNNLSFELGEIILKESKKKKSKKHKKCKEYSPPIIMNLLHLGYPPLKDWDDVPAKMLLDVRYDPGFVFGLKSEHGYDKYVGMAQGEEGNIIVVGSNGSGKSAGIAKPTLMIWQGAICVTDIKGELSDSYAKALEQGTVTRPFIVFDPMQADGIGYDPFDWVLKDGEDHLFSNIWEITIAIIPLPLESKEPFWIETEQAILQASLLYYYKCGLGFSEAITIILSMGITELVKELITKGGHAVTMIPGELRTMKPEVLANFDRGLRNKLMLFATDPYISHAFRSKREDTNCFTWEDLDNYNIFLRIPEDKIELWGGTLNLMYTQLIRRMERRPDKYSPEGKNNVQTLLLMDEFPRFGKLDMITNALSTLRSKNVNICLIVQSIAQIDKFYGECDRRIVFDNCQYKAILRAGDPGTQQYLSNLFGMVKRQQQTESENMDEYEYTVGYSKQSSKVWEARLFPHEFATLKDIPLITPDSYCRVEKIQLHNGSGLSGPKLPPDLNTHLVDDFVMPEYEPKRVSGFVFESLP